MASCVFNGDLVKVRLERDLGLCSGGWTSCWHICLTVQYSVIVRVRVVLGGAVVGDWCFDGLSGGHLRGRVNDCSSVDDVEGLVCWTWTNLLKLTQQTGTQHLLLQWLYLTLRALLRPSHGAVAHKPTTTLQHLLTNVKDRDEPNHRQGALYKIKCFDCRASYIGETGRNLNTRLTEHKWATIKWQTTTSTGTLLRA